MQPAVLLAPSPSTTLSLELRQELCSLTTSLEPVNLQVLAFLHQLRNRLDLYYHCSRLIGSAITSKLRPCGASFFVFANFSLAR